MYFVMLRTQKGHILPLLSWSDEGDDEVILFDTYEEAESAGSRNVFGTNFGFQVFEMED